MLNSASASSIFAVGRAMSRASDGASVHDPVCSARARSTSHFTKDVMWHLTNASNAGSSSALATDGWLRTTCTLGPSLHRDGETCSSTALSTPSVYRSRRYADRFMVSQSRLLDL